MTAAPESVMGGGATGGQGAWQRWSWSDAQEEGPWMNCWIDLDKQPTLQCDSAASAKLVGHGTVRTGH